MRIWILPALLIIFGLLSVITLSSVAPDLAGRQLIYFFVSGLLFYFVSRLDFSQLIELKKPSYIFACLFLLVPLIFSITTRNTARWIQVGDLFAIQPSQFTLPLVSLWIVSLASNTTRYTWQFFLKFFTLILIPAILILISPDLDTTIVIVTSLASSLFFLPIPWKFFAAMMGSVLLLGIVGWFIILQPYQKARVTSFLAPSEDIQGASYNSRQALIAVGSGQFIGRGLGQGIQSHLRFLPERQTDFIFASLAEEYGFLGTSIVIGLYTVLISFLFWAATHTTSQEGRLFLLIVALLFFLQATLNINMNIGLLPISGITLPLLSYGGSSILGLMLTLGIAQSLVKETHRKTILHIG